MKSGATVLLVDDEKEIIRLMEIYLKNEGYKILQAHNGSEALEHVRRQDVDVVVLDVMMPHMDGMEACVAIREISDVPIIMLSAKIQDMDKIAGLSIGADDYVTKPFNPLELMARIKSQLRRYTRLRRNSTADENQIEIGELTINTATHTVYSDGKEIKLTPREFAVLKLLAVNRGIVLGMDRIYQEVWNEPYMESKNTVMVHIRKIREKVERNPQQPTLIKTVWGIGYKMEG
ncbi:MAG TPA: response regulator transcription factor [Paenibacillus sp.]|nr:response regulator transcription factor [Paenibacillus sp.]